MLETAVVIHSVDEKTEGPDRLSHLPKGSTLLEVQTEGWEWWCTPLIPALRRQGQVNLREFEASLVYRILGQLT